MSSIAKHQQKIKSHLIAKLDELGDFLEAAIEEGRSAHEVEKELWDWSLKFGHKALGLFFKYCGPGDEGEVMELADGRQLKRLPSLHSRPYLTVFGEYSLPRYVYGSREGQKIESIPFDARLQLPERKCSYLLQDWNQAMAVDLPFGQVNGHLNRILSLPQSVNSLEQSNRQLSAAVNDFWAQEMESVTIERQAVAATDDNDLKTAKITVLSGDGKGVIMRCDELETTAVNASQSSGRPGTKRMALIGSVYSIDAYRRTPEQVLAALFADQRTENETDLPTRPKPLNKWVRGALLRNDQGKTDPQSDEIFSWLAGEARQRQPASGKDGRKPVVLLMDGQPSLWNSGEKHLPQEQFAVTEILDLIHATEYVWTATHLFYPKKSTQAVTHAREQMGQLLNNQVNTVIDEWRAKAVRDVFTPAQHNALETVCGYFTHHAHRMRYKDYLEEGWPIASGVIEGACRNVVKDRMEHSGMRWTMKGAHAMLALRSIELSGLWDKFMKFWRQRESQRLYSTAAANDEVFDHAGVA